MISPNIEYLHQQNDDEVKSIFDYIFELLLEG